MARTPSRYPVFTCAWPATGELLRRLRMVPSSAASGSEASYSGINGLFQAATRSSPSWRGDIRVVRESPAPLSIRISGNDIPRLASQSLTARSDFSSVAGPPSCAPSVRKTFRAMTLLLNLLMSRMLSASAADSQLDNKRAFVGTSSSRTRPDQLPPAWSHNWPKTAAMYSFGASRLKLRDFSPQLDGKVPKKVRVLPACAGLSGQTSQNPGAR